MHVEERATARKPRVVHQPRLVQECRALPQARAARRVVDRRARAVLPALVGVPLGAALAAVGLWLLGIAALGFALPIALASVVATPLWAAAYVGTEASEAWTRVWNAALDQQHQHGT